MSLGLGPAIKQLREKRHITQTSLARSLHASQHHLSMIEAEHRTPTSSFFSRSVDHLSSKESLNSEEHAVIIGAVLSEMLSGAEVTAVSALARKESRGAHSRDDYTERDDKNWLKHTLAWMENGGVRLGYKPVQITKFQPKDRSY